MKKRVLLLSLVIVSSVMMSACSLHEKRGDIAEGSKRVVSGKASNKYLQSGTIILSRRVPEATAQPVAASPESRYHAPLIGYFPPAESYRPADNEAWMEIDTEAGRVSVYEGTALIKALSAQGEVALASGRYYLTHKQKDPIWYAPDEYFRTRALRVPGRLSSLRYRRGALGNIALYPVPGFAVHSAPLWSPEVGGLRVSRSKLLEIYDMLPVGAPVVVK